MYWSKLLQFFQSLKVRLSLLYGLLFFLSGAMIFSAVGYFLDATLQRSGDAEVLHIYDQIKAVYVMGPRSDHMGEILSGSALPAPARRELERNFPGANLLYVYRTKIIDTDGRNEFIYTAFIAHRGKYYEFRLNRRGGFYSRQLNSAGYPARLRQLFSQIILARGRDNFSIEMRNADNSVYLGDYAAIPADERPYFRFMEFEFPDGRKLVLGRSLRDQTHLRNEYMMLFSAVLLAVALLGIVAAWWIARRFLHGVRQVTLAVNRVAAGDYSYRIGRVGDQDREVQELMETFNSMNERTEKLLKELKVMSDNVAHDLRTPLTRIYGSVELLLCERDLPEEIRTVCASISEETLRMKKLVNTIMDISHTNARPDDVVLMPGDLTALLRDFCEFMQPAVEDKNLAFELDIPDTPLVVNMDRTGIQRVLANLLENALKFTEKGKIKVALTIAEAGATLAVSDTGCGIPEEDQPQVFKRFFRGDSSRHLQGNGLGLALVVAIIHAHNWQIKVSSKLGAGTTFTITIPPAPMANSSARS